MNNDTNNERLELVRKIFLIVLAFLVILMIFNFFKYFDAKSVINENHLVTAEVTDTIPGPNNNREPIVYVDYQVDSIKYSNIKLGKIGYRPLKGDNIEIYYSENSHTQIAAAQTTKFRLRTIAYILFFIVITILGIIITNEKNAKWLMKKSKLRCV